MESVEARRLLGVDAAATWEDVRRAYRAAIRSCHPDTAGPQATARAARITEAFAQLRADRDGISLSAARRGRPSTSPTSAPTADPDGAAPRQRRPAAAPGARPRHDSTSTAGSGSRLASGAGPVRVLDADTLAVDGSAEEAFFLLLEAAHDIGEVSFVDADIGLLETIVQFRGTPVCSLVLSIQGRADHIEAFCTIESLEGTTPPPVAAVVEVLADLARQRAGQEPDGPVDAPPDWLVG